MFKREYDFVGKSGGNFKPKYTKPDQDYFLDFLLEYQVNVNGINKVFWPHCSFTTNVARLGDENQELIRPWLTKTAPGFDGGIVTEPGTAIAMFNADCPVIILFDKIRGRLAMLHAGFRCLVPENPHSPNIVQSAFNNLGRKPSEVDAFIGFGAGPCCYGVDHYDEIHRTEMERCIGVARKGPRREQLSLDIPSLARNRLRDCGVRDGAISYDRKCTAHARRENDGEGKYHSNIYEGKDAGRNLVLAWFKRV